MKSIGARAALLLSLLVVFLPGCKRAYKDPYQLVAVRGPVLMLRLQSSLSSTMFIADSGQTRYMPMRDNELLSAMGGDFGAIINYTPGSYDSLSLDLRDSVAYVNGRLHQLGFGHGSDMLPLLKSLTAQERRDIRMLHIIGELPASYLPWIDSIAMVNPAVDMMLQPDSLPVPAEQLHWLAARFKPTAMVAEMTPEEMPLLEAFSSLQFLYLVLDSDDSTTVEPVLPPMPALRSLSLVLQENDSLFSPQRFFRHHRGLAELALRSTRPPYEALSGSVPDLQRLYVESRDSLQRLPYGTWFGKLEGLFINQPLKRGFDIEGFQTGQPLQELGLTSSIPQDQFDALIAHQSQVHWLELYGDDTLMVRDYSALTQLKQLAYLTIGEQIGDIAALQSMKQLRFLSVPAADSTDSVKFSQLERALPGTRVTPNGGFCMGTGWLLLVVPIMLASAWIMRQWKNANSQT